jgi:hypothetical protein
MVPNLVKKYFEYYRTRDDTITSLVSTRSHTQLEEDPEDEGTNVEGRSDREGKG